MTIDVIQLARSTGTQLASPGFIAPYRLIVVSGALSLLAGTSSASAVQIEQAQLASGTTGGVDAPTGDLQPSPCSSSAAILELRRRTGFTWDQLASLFDVDRRSLHFWASGKPLSRSNEEHLHRILAVVNQIDQGNARTNREQLLRPLPSGRLPLDLLAMRNYAVVAGALSGSPTRVRAATKTAVSTAAELRAPRPPEEFVGALQDRVDEPKAKTRAAKSFKIPRS